MSRIAVLGLGAMGSRMAARLLAAGHAVTVWNRTATRTEVLHSAGAAVTTSPREAAAAADVVLAMLRDDDASRDVWLDEETGALAALAPGAIAIECSTLGLDWVRILAARCAAAGRAFLDAPVAGSRPQAEAGQLVFLVGGSADTVALAQPVLSALGSAVHHAGPAGAGAMAKLAVNALFGIQVATLAELVEAIRRQGFDAERALDAIAATPACSPAAKAAAGSMLADAFAPLFPVDLVEKDFGYVQAAAGAVDAAPMTAAARAVFLRAMREGLGADNLTGIVRLYRAAVA
ncbi:MAG: NAD(P)-dependent oxidoreductase [Rhodospirillaceae bacterium]|nr:NAD(P)-dependent oxidoreductase [Rhodospirillaceae bacterium]